MAASKKSAKGNEVDDLLLALEHPLKAEIGMVRALVLGADPVIGEGVKWKAPSFHAGAYFATVNLRSLDGVQIILHLDARKTAAGSAGMTIADPAGLLTWLAKDRASVKFPGRKEIKADGAAFQALIRQWIHYLP
ncbi:MAG: DUF1801 domain-containing protein [Betaproteobacteria bacterium]|nr:DUF1801 domain-containing protein [Betaproteobacteria bacterium]